MTRNVDFLVVGSGIAGLSFALKAAKHGKVLIVTKSNEDESNTKYAQGGVAVVVDKKEDSFEKHINDTLITGLISTRQIQGFMTWLKRVATQNSVYYIIRISQGLK